MTYVTPTRVPWHAPTPVHEAAQRRVSNRALNRWNDEQEALADGPHWEPTPADLAAHQEWVDECHARADRARERADDPTLAMSMTPGAARNSPGADDQPQEG